MTGDPRIRRMRWWDIEPVLALEAELFGDDPWTAGQFWSELGHVPETRAYLVLEDGQDLIGYAGLYAAGDDADVQTIAVAPGHGGRGHGSRLLEALQAEAERRGASRLTLEVRSDNAPAQRLYERFGFDTIARRTAYYRGADALVMQKRLRGVR